MAKALSDAEKLLIQNNPYYEDKYLQSRCLQKDDEKKSAAKTSRKSSKSSSSANAAAKKLAKEREKAEKERLALLKKQKTLAGSIMEKYDKLYNESYGDTYDAYSDGIRAQKNLNELMAQQGLYGSGYSQEKNRKLALDTQNKLADIYTERLSGEKPLRRKLEEVPYEMMEERYKKPPRAPKKYVDRIIEQLLKEELKKQAAAQKWADSAGWL